jgi:hypothetical protein
MLVLPATTKDPERVIGKICHIVASSDDGPRGDPMFPQDRRDEPDNLILLCGVHHDMIDVHPNTHTVADVRRWKQEHEDWVQSTLSDAVIALTFDELEHVAASLTSNAPTTAESLVPPTPPAPKMRHNNLTAQIASYYQIGQLRFADIETYIANTHDWDDTFSDRLVAGFRLHYDTLWERGLRGDALYVELAEWASGGRLADFPRTAAGIAVLSYLFHTCDVFEREPEDDLAV